MIKVKRIDHVAIAVADRDGAVLQMRDLFGLCAGAIEHVVDQQTDVAFLSADSDTTAHALALEIIAPASAPGGDDAGNIGNIGNIGLTRFLHKRGPGLHHICFEVEDLPAALASLKAAGVRLIDEAPRPGARGHMVAFIHPASTGGVLFELCATRNGAQA